MDAQIAEVADWLMGRTDETLLIRKEEDGDTDQVEIMLEKVAYIPGDPRRDDYIEEDRLVLQGEGRILTEGAEGIAAESLPRQQYEIPLQAGFRRIIADQELMLHTDRASYHITALPAKDLTRQ